MYAALRRYSTHSSRVIDSLKNPALFRTQGYANGEWLASPSTFGVYDPGMYPKPEAKIADVASYDKNDYNRAIQAANDAFQTFRSTTGRERATLLANMHQLMMQNQDDLAKLIVYENGKPFADAKGEISYAASFFQWFAEMAPHISGDVISSANRASRIMTVRQPVGVCGIITPWNFPTAMIARKLAAAVAAGCTAVIKPASETPLSALALAQLADDAGFPKGVVNVMPSAKAADAGTAICEHPQVKKVSFTGSTNVGKILMGQAASTLKKCSFELGGNAPFIVFEDVDIDAAVDGVIASKFRSSGQTCVCANRVFVHQSIYESFSHRLVERLAQSTVLGYGLADGTTHGPVIHDRSLAKVKEHVADAVAHGADVLLGGRTRPELGEYYHDLTVLGNVTPEMKIFHDETFGPVCPLIKFSSEDEVVRLANDTPVGLAGYFYTNDVLRVFRVAEQLEVGMVGVNTGGISEAALPFGGVKESGFGREGSKYGIDDYSIVKSVVVGSIH